MKVVNPKSRAVEESIARVTLSRRGSRGTNKTIKKEKMVTKAMSNSRDAKQLRKLIAKLIQQKCEEATNISAIVDKQICVLTRKIDSMRRAKATRKKEVTTTCMKKPARPTKFTAIKKKIGKKGKVVRRNKSGSCGDK